MNLFFFFGNIGTIAFVAIWLGITPVLNRQSLLFGVRVPEYAAQLPEYRQLKNSYYRIISVGALLMMAAAAALYLWQPQYSLLAWMYFPLLMVAVEIGAYLPQWQKAKTWKAQQGWSIPVAPVAEGSTTSSKTRLSQMYWGWYIAALALAVLLLIWTVVLYPSVPDRIITHWDLQMQPNAWADKSWGVLLMMPLIAIGLVALMAVCNFVVYRQKLPVSAEQLALSYAQHRQFRRMLGRSLGWLTFCFVAMFALLQPVTLNLWTAPPSYLTIVMVVTSVVGLFPVIYTPIRAGQAGSKLRPVVESADSQAEQRSAEAAALRQARDDDSYWKLGLFYFNPTDPAVLVGDRFGGNSGFNYARRPAQIFVIALVVLLVVLYVWLTVWLLQYPLY